MRANWKLIVQGEGIHWPDLDEVISSENLIYYLPASPSQTDHSTQVYWLSCSPCHGDCGQGLTEEFRQQVPPEGQYCWESGCHGMRPYDFTLDNKNNPQMDGDLARKMHASSLNAVKEDVVESRQLIVRSFDKTFGEIHVLIRFEDQWVDCMIIYAQPGYCKVVD
jgi:hypothetical protein